jgi:cold shock CspA family protein
MRGTVKTWEAEKKFGFIKPDDPDFSDTFFHLSQMPPGVRIAVGMRLEFEIGPPNDLSKKHKSGSANNLKQCE